MSYSSDTANGRHNWECQSCLDEISEVTGEIKELNARLVRLMSTAQLTHGCTLTEIGDAAGITKQSVHERLQRAEKK
jgi:hypothetical protein